MRIPPYQSFQPYFAQTPASPKKKPVLLLIFDGWGLRDPNAPGNAIAQAKPAHYEGLLKNRPWIPLEASGEAVGLPKGQAGNSEVGHLTMGTGRILFQDLPRIDKAISDQSFFKNTVFLDAVKHVKKTGGALHLMGLVSDGGVHSHLNHLLALIDFAKREGIQDVKVHGFLDGRDTSPKSAAQFIATVEKKLSQSGFSPMATLSGRYYAMDRDKRWDRTEKTYDVISQAKGGSFTSAAQALADSYQKNLSDEFLLPAVTDPHYKGMKDGDATLFFNFRPDRARQIAQAMTDGNFNGFHRGKVINNSFFSCMTPYDETWTLPIAFSKQPVPNLLADILSAQGKSQFRTAETEKYAHVTYFFNGGAEKPKAQEARKLVPSPKVATYDLQPSMSVKEVTDEIVQSLNNGQHDFIVANFANPDMVGHTGNEKATVDAVKAVDVQLDRIVKTVLQNDGTMLLTADHGKAETMLDAQGQPHTAHTTEPVPLVLVSNNPKLKLKQTPHTTGRPSGLSDIAPTILDLFQLQKPADMSGDSLLVRAAGNSTPFA